MPWFLSRGVNKEVLTWCELLVSEDIMPHFKHLFNISHIVASGPCSVRSCSCTALGAGSRRVLSLVDALSGSGRTLLFEVIPYFCSSLARKGWEIDDLIFIYLFIFVSHCNNFNCETLWGLQNYLGLIFALGCHWVFYHTGRMFKIALS